MAIHVQIDPLERTATLRGVHSLCAGESSEVILSGVPDADTPTLSLRVYRDASESVQVACSVRPGTDPAEESLVPVEGRAALRRGTLDLRTSAVSEWASEDAAAAAAADEARRSGSKEPEARAAASYRRPDSAWLVVADSSRVWAACAVPFVLRPFDDALSPDPEVPLPSYAERAEAAAAAAESAAQRAERAAEDAESAEATGKVGRDELFDDPDSASPKVKPSLLPSYVDDVLEVAELPQSGESGKLYVVTGTNAVYRWSGSSFVEVSPSRDWSGELARKQDVIPDLEAIRSKANSALQAHQDISGKRDLTDLSVDRGKWLLVKPDGTLAWLGKPDPQRDEWTGDGFTLSFGEEGGDPFWFLWKTDSSGGFVFDESVSSPPDANKLEFTDGVSVYRLVRGSRLALDTELPVVDDTVTRASGNPVKSSGIWSAIWGALTALPTGVASLYDWCVAQLAGKLNTDGYTSWSITYPVSGYELLSCNWNRRIGASGGWAVELLNVSSGEKETFTVSGAKTITEIVVPSEDPMRPLFSLVREKMCKTKTSELTNDGNGVSPFATVSQIPEISGKADAADLRYRIAEAEYDQQNDIYILADRTVNLITSTTETSIDIDLPAAQAGHSRDFYLAVTCGSTAPALNTPSGVALVNANGGLPDLSLSADATTVLRFTEVEEADAESDPPEQAVFCVTGGANGGGSLDLSVLADEFSDQSTYEEGDIVQYQGELYMCEFAVETPGDWDPSDWTSAEPVLSVLLQAIRGKADSSDLNSKAESTALAPAWVSGHAYLKGDHVSYEGLLYECLSTVAGSTDPSADTTHWKLTDLAAPDATLDILSDGRLRVVAANGTTMWTQGYALASESAVALSCEKSNYYSFSAPDAFSASTAYAIGDQVTYTESDVTKVYQFNAAHAAGAWTGTDVDEAPIRQKFALPKAPSGVVGDFVLDIANTAAFVAEVVLDGVLGTDYDVIVEKGRALSDVLSIPAAADGVSALVELYFTMTAFGTAAKPAWRVVRLDVEKQEVGS